MSAKISATQKAGRPPRALFFFGAALLLGMLAAIGVVIYELRRDAIADAGVSVSNLGVVLAEHASRSLQSVDMALTEIRARVEEQHADRVEVSNRVDLRQVLTNYAAQTPQVGVFVVVNSAGDIVQSSRLMAMENVNVADRSYFQQLRDSPEDRVVISEPVTARGGEGEVVVVARRLRGSDGRFAGVVIGSMRLDLLDSFYRAIGLPSSFAISVLRRDGTMLTRYPLVIHSAGETVPVGSRWYTQVALGGGTYAAPSYMGSGSRYVSVHLLRDYPVVVDISVAEDAALATWRRQTAQLSVGAVAAFLCALLLGRGFVQQLGHAQRAHRSEMERASELEALKARLERKSRVLQATLDHMEEGLLMVEPGGRVEIYNQRLIEMLDLPADLMATCPQLNDVLRILDARGEFAGVEPEQRAAIWAAGRAGRAQTLQRVRPCGTILEIRCVPTKDGGTVRTFHDITERSRSHERVRFLAHYDGLTRLLNRSRFNERLADAVAGGRADNFALLYLDLDRFKEVNDTHGHPLGDRLLQAVSSRLLATVRDGDAVARIGGDEFCIIADAAGTEEVATTLAERLLRNVIAPYEIDNIRLRIGLSIGIALFPVHGTTPEALVRHADAALYTVKHGGRNAWAMARPETLVE